MTLYSYIVARDYGFAPNPFYGMCTLATCKPEIRKMAKVEDWVVGTGSKHYSLDGKLVYVMRVQEALSFEEYWADTRFIQKRPNLRGCLKQAYGDNIYHCHPRTKKWMQENSHHSLRNGRPNPANIEHDTRVSRVLIGTQFAYWGGYGPAIPSRFRKWRGQDLCHQHPGHKCLFPDGLVESFVHWFCSLDITGYRGQPKEWG